MRKMSAYARKKQQAMKGKSIEQLAKEYVDQQVTWHRVLSQCAPYAENKRYRSDKLLLELRLGLQQMIDMTLPSDDYKAHDCLSHAIAVAHIRAVQIAGRGDDNPALPILRDAAAALSRTCDRWHKTKKWGLDGPAIQKLKDAVNLYEEILMASTPRQMQDAFDIRLARLEELQKINHQKEQAERESKKVPEHS